MSFAWKFAFWGLMWISIIVVGCFSPRILESWLLPYILVPIGSAFIVYGLLLNAIAGRTLKKYGHMEIKREIKKPDKLVKTGIYSCMRHPAQFGSVFFGIGISLLTLKLIAILYAGWISFLALYFIMAIEERETLDLFGDEYCGFIKSRKPFTFSLSCLKKGIEALREKSF